VPIYAILSLPVRFAAGMSPLDTIDGSFMNFACGWAFSEPASRVCFNLTITGLSVVVAFAVGTIELGSIPTPRLGLRGGFWSWLAGVDLNTAGYLIAGLFAVTWLGWMGARRSSRRWRLRFAARRRAEQGRTDGCARAASGR
jgi:high-affinity nickel-transport protein